MKMRVLSLSLAVLMLLSTLCGCAGGDEASVRRCLSNFETAAHSLDIHAMLEEITPTISDPIRVAMDLVGLVSQMDTEEMLDKISSALFDLSGTGGAEFFESIQLKVDSVSAGSGSATAYVTMTYVVGGESKTAESEWKFTYKSGDERWYISSVKIL